MIKIVFAATDGSESAERAVAAAGEFAAQAGAKLVIGHVMEDDTLSGEVLRMAEIEHLIDKPTVEKRSATNVPTWMVDSLRDISTPGVRHQVIRKLGEEALERAEEAARKAGAKDIETVLLEGDVAAALIQAATSARADLVAVGTRGHGAVRELVFGSVSNKVVHGVDVPCLVVK